jgi:hypothetical protein|tara:strand:- start:709 stop:1206 length:498 start_codon:yes stop_codon:yes gene_type:complete
MAQAIKRYYGNTNANSAVSIYTCPSSTVAKIIINSVTMAYGFFGIHTSTSSSINYALIRNHHNDTRSLLRVGDELVDTNGSDTNRFTFYPTGNHGSAMTSGIENVNYNANGSNQVNGAGTDYRSVGYTAELYISGGQIFYWYPISGAGYNNAWDIVVIEEVGSGT